MKMTRRETLGLLAAATAQAAQLAPLQVPNLNGSKSLTLHLRLTAPIRAQLRDPSARAILTVTPNDGSLAIEFWTDANPAPLRLVVPPSAMLPAGTHEIVLRYAGAKLDLFADGVLVDEEWPHGSLRAAGEATLHVEGEGVLTASVSERALSDAEVLELSGGSQRAVSRRDEILGPPRPVRQFWRPHGFNTNAGDAMPLFHEGRFHVFYLLDRRHHKSKWGLGAHQWAHLSSPDLKTWEHHPMALPITEEWEGSICTGSAFYDRGVWYAFYATRMPDRSERLAVATSRDGIHFQKQIPTAFAEPQAPYRRGPNRDPFVWKDEQGIYRMLVTAELTAPEFAHRGGAIELLTSPDLKEWTAQPPFLLPGYVNAQPECSDLFEWNGWHYLLFGIDGATHYRMARSSTGPWAAPRQDLLDCPQSRVMKTAAFHGNRRLGVSFVAEDGYAGDLVFRELVQRPDGTLGTKTPLEMQPQDRGPVALRPQMPGASLKVGDEGGYAAAEYSSLRGDFRVRCRLRASAGCLSYGLAVRGAAAWETGMELRMTPAGGRVEWRPVKAHSLDQNSQAAIDCVSGLDGPVTLDIVVQGSLFDVCLNGERTLVHRAGGLDGDRLLFWTHGGTLTAGDIVITGI